MKRTYTDRREAGILRSVIILFLGVIFSLPDVQIKEVQTSVDHSRTRLSNSFFPIALKLARPDKTPTLRPLYARVLDLDGKDDYAFAPDQVSLELGRGAQKDFTIEAFFYVPTGALGLRTVVEREQYYLKLFFTQDAADGIQLMMNFENGDLSLFPVVNLKTGWHHLAVVFNEEAIPGQDITGIYLDGSLEATRTDPDLGPVLPSSGPFYIGHPSSNPYRGWIEEMRLSSIVRYSTNFSVPDQYFEPDEYTRALWHFDEMPGSTTFADFSGNGNHLTGINGAMNIEPAD